MLQHEAMPVVYLKPGEYHVALEPCRVETVLGSCVSVTLFCPVTRLAAINHAMLPHGCDSDRFVSVSLDNMLRRLHSRGACLHHLEAKMFGGANSFERTENNYRHVGVLNVEASMHWLKNNKIKLVKSDVGGRVGRKLVFLSGSGKVYIKRLKSR